MEYTLEALATHLKGRVMGDGRVVVRNVTSFDTAQEGDIVFADDARHLATAFEGKASAFVVTEGVDLGGRSGIAVSNPKLAFALLLQLFHPTPKAQGAVHPTAVLGKGVELSHPVDIRAHAVIGDRVRIGQGTIILPGTFIGDDVTIGERCLLGPNVVIYHQTVLGHRVMIHGGSVIGGDGFGYVFNQDRYVKVPQVGNVVIEDDVEIGCNSCVDRATTGSTLVQRGSKFDNHVQVGHNNRIGQHVILAGQVGLAGSVSIGDYSLLGGKSGVIDHLHLGERVRVGAATVVTKNAAPDEVLWGYPARPINEMKHSWAAVNRFPVLLKTVKELAVKMLRLEQRLDQIDRGSTSR